MNRLFLALIALVGFALTAPAQATTIGTLPQEQTRYVYNEARAGDSFSSNGHTIIWTNDRSLDGWHVRGDSNSMTWTGIPAQGSSVSPTDPQGGGTLAVEADSITSSWTCTKGIKREVKTVRRWGESEGTYMDRHELEVAAALVRFPMPPPHTP